jgi:two-component system, response regulator YesN
MKVFLVDDDIIVNEGMKKLIPWNRLDSTIIGEAKNGRLALAKIMEMHPDLVITDIKMPLMDGLELSRCIHESMAYTSVILLSAYEDFSYARTAMQYGVKDYIIKPIDRQKVNQLIESICEISARLNKRSNLYSSFDVSSPENGLSEALKTMDEAFIQSYFDKNFSDYYSDCNLVTELCFKLVGILIHIVETIGLTPEYCGIQKNEITSRLISLKSAKAMKSYMLGLYLDTMRYIGEKKDVRTLNLVEEVDSYIMKEFSDPNLTVSGIAEHFNITANYLSIIYHQVKGINISSQITGLRMKKARDLLRNQSMSISEVCNLSGYNDGHYFSKVFKKLDGVTPSEYRNLIYQTSRSGDEIAENT